MFLFLLKSMYKNAFMKKILLLTTVVCLAMACKKNSAGTNNNVAGCNVYSTKWELRKSEGSIFGNANYLPGNGILIEFYATDSFKTADPTSSIIARDSGTYTITNTSTSGDYYLTRKFINNGYNFTKVDSIRFVGTQLVFLAHNGWADEPTLYYEKL